MTPTGIASPATRARNDCADTYGGYLTGGTALSPTLSP